MRIRRLEELPDGTAEVTLLTDPIPRHVSLVKWGANNAPATSWMSKDGGASNTLLREAPSGDVVDPARATGSGLSEFISETIEAWKSVCGSIMSTALEPADRGARLRAATVQAAARVAAVMHSLGSEIRRVAMSAPIPAGPREFPTVDGEVDRVHFAAGLDDIGFMLHGACLEIASSGSSRAVELVLSVFSAVADILDSSARSIPAGVVGVAQKVGKRHNSADLDRLRKIRDSIEELLAGIESAIETDDVATKTFRFYNSALTQEIDMITMKDLETLVDGDPKGFLSLVQRAVKSVDAKEPKTALKFMWGETGVDPYDISNILGTIPGITSGLDGLIAAAVGGIDIDRAMSTSPTVASTMKGADKSRHELAMAFNSASIKSAVSELKTNPNGDLATSIRSAVSLSVGAAIAEGIKTAMRSFVDGGGDASSLSFDEDDEDDASSALIPEIPGRSRK